ncbi:MAG: Ig-like domain-containing protein [Anaerolineales bacterium]|jgi:hypothetical protein
MHPRARFFPLALLAAALTALGLVFPARADGNGTLILSLSRDFGYSSGSGQIQGTFTLHATGPGDLSLVDFMIDGVTIAEVTHAPFQLQFNTDGFAPGKHSLSAVGYTSGGQELQSAEIQAEFVTASQASRGTLQVVIPILAVILLAVLGSALISVLASGGRKASLPAGAERNYGLRGGAICPRCGRPFVLGLLSPHLLFFKLARCPYCGRFGLVRRASPNELRQAESAELDSGKSSPPIPDEGEEEKLRRELDESRYRES